MKPMNTKQQVRDNFINIIIIARPNNTWFKRTLSLHTDYLKTEHFTPDVNAVSAVNTSQVVNI